MSARFHSYLCGRIAAEWLIKMKRQNWNGEWYFKVSGADIRTKVIVIRQNAHKYSVSAMCKCLKISRSNYYYEASSKPDETALETKISTTFRANREVYGSRKIKKELEKQGLQISRRRICRSMKRLGWFQPIPLPHSVRVRRNAMNLQPKMNLTDAFTVNKSMQSWSAIWLVCGSLKSGIRTLYWFHHLRMRVALDIGRQRSIDYIPYKTVRKSVDTPSIGALLHRHPARIYFCECRALRGRGQSSETSRDRLYQNAEQAI